MDTSHPLVVRLQGCRALSIILTNTAHIAPRISAEPGTYYLFFLFYFFIFFLFLLLFYFYFFGLLFVSYITM